MTELSTKSAPLGMFEDAVFTSRTYEVPPGCRILVYSDGASEITPADAQQFSGLFKLKRAMPGQGVGVSLT